MPNIGRYHSSVPNPLLIALNKPPQLTFVFRPEPVEATPAEQCERQASRNDAKGMIGNKFAVLLEALLQAAQRGSLQAV